ncbi:MAG: hypothetical protein K2X03_01265 [Bryobacteraceae bacterium]|nr:hypothetical protein [Bryobacteraceae bacterium]
MSRLLSEEGYPSRILWVQPGHVVYYRRRWYVHLPNPTLAAMVARSYFRAGFDQGLGVTVDAICRLGDATCCSICVPSDVGAAYRAGLQRDDVRMSVLVEPLPAYRVENRLVWALLRYLGRFNTPVVSRLFRR